MSILFQFDRIEFILFHVITILWILEFVIFPSHFKGKDKNETKTFLKILGVLLISHTLTITFTVLGWFKINNDLDKIWIYLSLFTYPVGLVLRYISIIYLGTYFTRDVEVSKDQNLVSKGPYRILRHSLYLGLYLLTISVPLFFANWLMTIVSMVIMFMILNVRMQIEEKLMEEALRKAYTIWKKKRYRFIPFI
ncbi:MAG: isoprenylcysteine carboxylmethyltransferase family protein [Acholeplasmataceae bacterium]